MKAVILAAGINYEIGQAENGLPVCMLPIGEETIIQRQIRLLSEMGFDESDISVVTGYGKEKLCLPKRVKSVDNAEYASTHNSYSLYLGLKDINEDVIVLDGDIIFEPSVIAETMNNTGNLLIAIEANIGYGKTGIATDKDGNVTDVGKHIAGSLTYGNIFKLKSEDIPIVMARLAKQEYRKEWYTVPFMGLLNKLQFSTVTVDTPIYEINSLTDYFHVKKVLGIEKKLIMVAGASGFLGKKVYNILRRSHNVIGTCGHPNKESSLDVVNVLDRKTLDAYVSIHRPSIIINAIGMADPDDCKRDRQAAEAINVESVRNLLGVSRKYSVKLIHISTDYIFDGKKDYEYGKEEEYSPINYYGETKAEAEKLVKGYNNSLIIRVPLLYGYNDENDKETFPIKVLNALKESRRVYADNVQIRYPALIDEVAFGIEKSIERTGVLHVSSTRGVTKYGWAKCIAELYGYAPGLIEEKNGADAERPKHVKLRLDEGDIELSDFIKGTKILRKQMGCIFRLIYKSNPVESVYERNVGEFRMSLGKELCDAVPTEVIETLDCVVPVPASGMYYAMGFSERSGVPYIQALSKNDKQTRSFQISDIAKREKVISDKIYPIRELITGKKLAIVDEAIFTGTTLRLVCDMLHACGVAKIYICIPTPIAKRECHQYVMPDRGFLFNSPEGMDLEEYFKADGVYFQSEELFIKNIGHIENVCSECFVRAQGD